MIVEVILVVAVVVVLVVVIVIRSSSDSIRNIVVVVVLVLEVVSTATEVSQIAYAPVGRQCTVSEPLCAAFVNQHEH